MSLVSAISWEREPFEHSFLEVEFRGLFEDLKEKFGGTAMLYYPVPD